MPAFSLEELKKLIRRIEFNKTEPELLIELVNKAMKEGEKERERISHVSRRSQEIFNFLKERDLIHKPATNTHLIDSLKKSPVGCVDGSFQIVGGIGGKWYVIYGVAQVLAKTGFTLQPTIRVDGDVKPLEATDEGEAYRKAELLMMIGETKSFRMVAQDLDVHDGTGYLLIDGPIIDPPLCSDRNYIADRVEAIRFCHKMNVEVIGFVKRVRGKHFLSYLQGKLENKKLDNFVNDLDLLAGVLFNAAKESQSPVYTHPISYDESYGRNLPSPYRYYKDEGLTIYYSYYKPSLRGRIFRLEYASTRELNDRVVAEIFQRVVTLISKVWTLPGMDEPLPITIAHNKCNVRRGAAETLYYEIITRAFCNGSHMWLEDILS